DADTVGFTLDVHDSSGTAKSSQSFSLAAKRQVDVIAAALPGFEPMTYGTMCTSTTSGADSALAGDLMFYRLNEGSFSQAFSSPYLPARTGKQFLTFSTYFLARNFTQLGNAV